MKKNIEPIKKLWPMPDNLGPHGREYFSKIGPEFVRLGLITPLNKVHLETLCALIDIREGCLKTIKKNGPILADGSKNPASTLLMQTVGHIHKISEKLNPSPQPGKASDPMAGYELMSVKDFEEYTKGL